MAPRRARYDRPGAVEIALKDLAAARTAYRHHLEEAANKAGGETWQSQGFLPLVPRRQRYIFVRAKHAFWELARLEPDEHAELIAEYGRCRGREEIPPEVAAYLAQSAGRHRPRRLHTAGRERKGQHVVWLLWGYYRRERRPAAREHAWDVAAVILGTSPDSVRAWVRGRVRPW